MTTLAYSQNIVLPWSLSAPEDSRFKKLLVAALACFLIVGVIIPNINLPEIEREKKEALPPQLARVIIEKKIIPPPVKPKPKKKTEPKVVEKPKVEKKPAPKPVVKPKVKPKPTPAVANARAKAKKSGVLAFQDDLAAMRDSVNVATVATGALTRGNSQVTKTSRSILAGKASAKSGGINTSTLSRNAGGNALSARETTAITGPVAEVAATVAQGSGGSASGRGDEEIRRVMDKNKGAIFAIYNRALRKNPSLEGNLTFEMVIEPSGSVSAVKLIKSELNDPALERKILARIRLINFGAASVGVTRVNYAFDFFPY